MLICPICCTSCLLHIFHAHSFNPPNGISGSQIYTNSPTSPCEVQVCVSICLDVLSGFLQGDLLFLYSTPHSFLMSFILQCSVMCHSHSHLIDQETRKPVKLNPLKYPLEGSELALHPLCLVILPLSHIHPIFFILCCLWSQRASRIFFKDGFLSGLIYWWFFWEEKGVIYFCIIPCWIWKPHSCTLKK